MPTTSDQIPNILKESFKGTQCQLKAQLFHNEDVQEIFQKYFSENTITLAQAEQKNSAVKGTLETSFLGLKGMQAEFVFEEESLTVTLTQFEDISFSKLFPALIHSFYDDLILSQTELVLTTKEEQDLSIDIEQDYGLPSVINDYEHQKETFRLKTTFNTKVAGLILEKSMKVEGTIELIDGAPRFELKPSHAITIPLFEKNYSCDVVLLSLGALSDTGQVIAGQGYLGIQTYFGSLQLKGLISSTSPDSIMLLAQDLSIKLDQISSLTVIDLSDYHPDLMCRELSLEFSFLEKKVLSASIAIFTGEMHELISDLITLENAVVKITWDHKLPSDKTIEGNVSLGGLDLYGALHLPDESIFCTLMEEVSLNDFIKDQLSLPLPLPEMNCEELELFGNRKHNHFNFTAKMASSWEIAHTSYEVSNLHLQYQNYGEEGDSHFARLVGTMIMGKASFSVNYETDSDSVLRGHLLGQLSVSDLLSDFSSSLSIPKIVLDEAFFQFELDEGTFVLYGKSTTHRIFLVGMHKESWKFACGLMTESLYKDVDDMCHQKIPLLKNINKGCLLFSDIEDDISNLLDEEELPFFSGQNLTLKKGISIFAEFEPSKTLKSILPLNSLLCEMNLGSQPTLLADLGPLTITLGRESLTIGQARLVISEEDLTVQGEMLFHLGAQIIRTDVSLDIGEDEIAVLCNVQGTIDPPLGMNVIVKDFGVTMGLDLKDPGITLGAELKFTRKNDPQIYSIGFVFDLSEDINPIVLKAFIPQMDLPSVLSLISQSAELPKYFSTLTLKDFDFLWAEQDFVLPDGTTVVPGFQCQGSLMIQGLDEFDVYAAVVLSENKVAAKAQMAPISFGKILSLTGQGKKILKNKKVLVSSGGPYFEVSNFQSPYIQGNADICLLGFRENVEISIGEKGLSFLLNIQFTDICRAQLKTQIQNSQLNLSSNFRLDLSTKITLNLEVVTLTIDLDTDIDIKFIVKVDGKQQLIAADGNFEFEEMSFSFHFEWEESLDLNEFASEIEKKIIDNADVIFKDLKNEGQKLVLDAKEELEALEKSTSKEIEALNAVGEQAIEVAKKFGDHLSQEEAEVEKQIQKIESDITTTLKNTEITIAAIKQKMTEDVDKIDKEAESIVHDGQAIVSKITQETEAYLKKVSQEISSVVTQTKEQIEDLEQDAKKREEQLISSAQKDAKKILNDAQKAVEILDAETHKILSSLKHTVKHVVKKVRHVVKKVKHWFKHLF